MPLERPDRTANLTDMKSRIVTFMRIRGPCLPIHISKETKTSLLLSSAFLSDLSSEKTIKISNMKVGGSPLYYLPGQENMLENFEKFLNHKEREALSKIKLAKVLKDDELEPAIRVALRNIQDFALPYPIKFRDASILFWQYYLVNEEEVRKMISDKLEQLQPKLQEKQEEKKIEEQLKEIKTEISQISAPEIKEEIEEKLEIEEKPKTPVLEITENVKKEAEKKQERERAEKQKSLEPIFIEQEKPKRVRIPTDKFLDQVKLFLASKNTEIVKIEKFDKKEITAKIRLESGKACFLLALDKKRVDAQDLAKAYKKSEGLPYIIITRGEASKKLKEEIDSYKNLERMEKLE